MTVPISIICTTYNEEDTIQQLLDALRTQSLQPREIVICDGGSQDATRTKIQQYAEKYSSLHLRLILKEGNRSTSRNEAIKAATSSVIAITDAGCIPEKKWLEKLWHTYQSSGAPVVAGYYRGLPQSAFQEAVVPYVLVMPDRVDPSAFLPATRSMLLEKRVWQAVGMFDEALSLNEDYAFAQKIKSKGFQIVFAKDAIVGWFPRKNIRQFYIMIERFAQGDIQAGLLRPKVLFIFIRYSIVALVLLVTTSLNTWRESLALAVVLFVLYSIWAVHKNTRYVKTGWYWLPVLQFTSDVAVMKGSLQAAFAPR